VRSHGPVRFVLWNSNYHAAHHLVPSVTYRYLPRLDDAVGERALHRSRSYFAFHAGQLSGVMPGRRSPRHP
jgi:fatty acid desaturase